MSETNLISVTGEFKELMQDEDEVRIFQSFQSAAENASSLHRGLKHETLYSGQRAVFRPLPSRLLIPLLEESLKHNDLVVDLKYKPQGCGWNNVLDCIDTAKASYDEKGKNSKIRAWARRADTTAGALESLVSMIPDDKGLSVLREGLVFLFQAWQRRIKNREDILHQLEDVPVLLSAVTVKWKLYPYEKRLSTAVQDLCRTVIDSMTVLISILLQTQKGSFLTKSIHRLPARESGRIEAVSRSIESSKRALDVCVEGLDQERLAYLTKTSTNILSETKATRQTVHDVRSDHGLMMRTLHDIAAGQKEATMTKSQVEDTMNDMFRQWFREIAASNMQTGLYHMVEENQYCRRLGYDAVVTLGNSPSSGLILVTKAQLIQHLDLSHAGSVEEDMAVSAGKEPVSRTQAWNMRLLLVDGHCQSSGNGKTSPLSLFCASLASTLAESASLVILQYFCGHHTLDSAGLPGGPLGLIKSLLGQLLHQPDDVLPPNVKLNKRLFNGADHDDDVDRLCEIFGELFLQISPSKITICILDEIAEFEGGRGRWVDGMCLVADQLRYMVHHFEGPQKLKVLMTSANKSVVVSSRFEEEERASLRGYGLPNHSPGRLVISDSDLSLPRLP